MPHKLWSMQFGVLKRAKPAPLRPNHLFWPHVNCLVLPWND